MNEATSTLPPPLVSIVVVTYNALNYARRCLEGILTCTQSPFELIVVDNASDRETRDYLQSLDRITLILNDENRLWVAACNQGMQASDPRSPYVLILNSDIEIKRSDWLDVMISVLESESKIGIVGPGRIRMAYGPMYGYIDGWCMLIRRELLKQIGYFDEVRWPWTSAEMGFEIAAFAAGWIHKVISQQDAIVLHHSHKSHTPEIWSKVRSQYAGPEHRPYAQFAKVMKEHGLKPRLSPIDWVNVELARRKGLWRLSAPLSSLLDKNRFYYAEPVGTRAKKRA